jgi:hypothetical protein
MKSSSLPKMPKHMYDEMAELAMENLGIKPKQPDFEKRRTHFTVKLALLRFLEKNDK